MKNSIKSFLIIFLAAAGLIACEKDENRVVFEGGTAPVLTASTTTIALSAADAKKEAVKFSWTNPDYKFNTGVSSMDVTYAIEIDTTGANFTNPDKQEVSISRDLSYSLTVEELNKALVKMKLVPDMPHNIEMRLIASLQGAVPLVSNVIKFANVVPYEDFAVPPPPTDELYITGDATPADWTNSPPASQKATRVDKGTYYIEMAFQPGKAYKFLSTPGQWQPQYGGSSATGGTLGANMGGGSDPAGMPTPSEAGTYRVDLNFRTGTYTVTKK